MRQATPRSRSFVPVLCTLLAWIVLAVGCAPRQTPPAAAKPSVAGELADRVPVLLEAAEIPGLAVGWVADGEVAGAAVFGVSNAETGELVTEETVFEAASLTKPVFAYAVLRLAERGELDLDRPLVEYLPYPDVEDDPRLERITARHVLSHTTGFPNWRRDRPLSIAFEPGERFSYSGEGFVFLQKVVEKLTGLDGAAFVEREVLSPLGMDSSTLVWSPGLENRAATGHDSLSSPAEKWQPEAMNAASSLHTTAGDYARFLAEVLEPTLLEPETVAAMLGPHIQVEDAEGVAWGLGWGLETGAEAGVSPRFWHWGDNRVFRCLTLGDPATGRAMIYFTNSENGLSILDEMLALTVGGGPHPGPAWAGYDAYDAPSAVARRHLLRAGLDGGGEAVREAYDTLRQEVSPEDSESVFAERTLNNLGYQLLGREALGAAVEVLTINTELYPDSGNVWDSLGEAYMRSGEKALAIANYQKSLELDPENTNAVEMLERLRAE